jgi:hypothetical protein
MLKKQQIKMAVVIKNRNGIKAAAKYLKSKGFSIEAAQFILLGK